MSESATSPSVKNESAAPSAPETTPAATPAAPAKVPLDAAAALAASGEAIRPAGAAPEDPSEAPKPRPASAEDAVYVTRVAIELKLPVKGVMAVVSLLGEGATVPFIARYRKEATGELDEVQITNIRDRVEELRALDDRRAAIIKSLNENKSLTPEQRASIIAAVNAAPTLTKLEDIYAPYRPKRRTRATVARERGLGPLAEFILANQAVFPDAEAAKFVVPAPSEDKQDLAVPDAAAALAGARDIIAEHVSDDAAARAACRELFTAGATITSEAVKEKAQTVEAQKFKDYFELSEPLRTAPSHRILAIRRGEKEGFLYYRITVDDTAAVAALEKLFVNATPIVNAAGAGNGAKHVLEAVADSWKRLLGPSLETEARLASKKRADEEAIRVFAANVSQLLMAAPLGQKPTLALDPGFRTGCKLVVLDASGKLLHHDVIHATAGSDAQRAEAEQKLLFLCAKHAIKAIAIGNGTASRETEAFVRAVFATITDEKERAKLPVIVSVNESGASIYSAGAVAREEFPNEDVTVRGAVSIGRRLQDPLAELVKLDPKNIGVGQYQHDVDQNALKKSLDDVVVSCVNRVGVELNTASKQLLSYVSGLSTALAAKIVAWRDENGVFKSREDLRKISGLGPKAFEQCAGFLRIRDAANPLDASAVHPERYPLVEKMAADAGVDVRALLADAKARAKVDADLEKYVSDDVGLPTLEDILDELEKPGRDPREKFETFSFAEGVHEMGDLREGMRVPGIVTNVTAFGAFVDVGVHQDGLLHISQMADHFVSDPKDIVKVGDRLTVTVMEVDIPRKRIALSLRANPEKNAKSAGENAAAGGANTTGGAGGNGAKRFTGGFGGHGGHGGGNWQRGNSGGYGGGHGGGGNYSGGRGGHGGTGGGRWSTGDGTWSTGDGSWSTAAPKPGSVPNAANTPGSPSHGSFTSGAGYRDRAATVAATVAAKKAGAFSNNPFATIDPSKFDAKKGGTGGKGKK
jgi:uncharacterized protein